MPLYEYRCSHCDKPFERYARTFNDQAECPVCGTADVTRLLSTFAVSSGGHSTSAADRHPGAGCGEGPPCGAAHCGRLAN